MSKDAWLDWYRDRKEELTSVFADFEPLEVEVKYDYHYCLTARRR